MNCPSQPAESGEAAAELHRRDELGVRRAKRQGASGAKDARAAHDRLAALAGTIEAEIVPRLLMSLSASCQALATLRMQAQPPLTAADVSELARLLLGDDPEPAARFAQSIRERGAPLEGICLELFEPAARRLSELWEQDQCDFTQLTIGLSRLYMVLQQLSGAD
jgi:hypothetical protein